MSSAESFETNGYVQVKEFLDAQTMPVVSQYLENRIRRGEWVSGCEGPSSQTKMFCYADPLIEALLLAYKDTVEQIVGKELEPTYSYTRIYQPGEELLPHTDRPACEISVTVNVAHKGPASPIYMQYKDKTTGAYALNAGDAVIYKGCEVTHWRTPLTEEQLNVQFMLHYVDKNGPNMSHAKDKRPAYGFRSNEKLGGA